MAPRRLPSAPDDPAQQGFTLIELMVVVLIIAVLITIAIPTFFGARSKAQDRAAQSNLRTALVNAKVVVAGDSDYTQVFATSLAGVEPNVTFVGSATTSSDPKTVSVKGASANILYLAAWSKSGTCFGLRDDVAAGGGTTYAEVGTDATACTADAAAGATYGASW